MVQKSRRTGLCGLTTQRHEWQFKEKVMKNTKITCPSEQTELAESYREKGDFVQAVHWFRQAAEQGYREAQNKLALRYQQGEGVEQDSIQAAYWLRLAAEQGLAQAQRNLGYCHEDGEGVEQSYEQAAYWLHQAAVQSDAAAQHALGVCWYKGQGVEQDSCTALYWFVQAAEEGHTGAQFIAGAMYRSGDGIEADHYAAKKFFQKAVENSTAQTSELESMALEMARNELEFLEEEIAAAGDYENENLDIALDYLREEKYDLALHVLKKAARVSNSTAQNLLGTLLFMGENVEEDIEQGIAWLERASKLGNREAQEFLESKREYIEDYRKKTVFRKEGIKCPADIAREHYKQGEYHRALEMLENAADLRHTDLKFQIVFGTPGHNWIIQLFSPSQKWAL